MHEFWVARQAVDKILEAALNKGAKRINRVELLLGELSLVGEEQLIFWMREMLISRKDIASDVKIDLKKAPALIKCRQCGYEGNLKPGKEKPFYPVFFCPSCGDGNIEVEGGRECVLNRIQLEI